MPKFIQQILACFLLLALLPIIPILYLLVKIDSSGPFIFKQKRAGKNMKPFTMYKIRTMVTNAEKLKHKYLKANEADGPVFKIRNDPRYTKVGKIISRMAIDEIPQLINVIKGDMAIVGPRPLPLKEAKQIPKMYYLRFSILPGMTSPWIISGSHELTFKKWMELDLDYIHNRNPVKDLGILIYTFLLLLRLTLKLY